MTDLSNLVTSSEPDLDEVAEASSETVLKPGSLPGIDIIKAAEVANGFNMLIYGNPGVGKTLLAGSADLIPEMRPVLVVDIEGGAMPLKGKYPNVDVGRVKTFADLQSVYNELRKGKSGYKTVIIDSLSEAQKFSMYGVMKEMLAKDDAGTRDPDVPGMHEWMKNTEQIRLFVRAFRDLPVNTIFTALAVHEKDQRTGLFVTKPALSAKLSYEVAGFVDIVLYMYMKVRGQEALRLLLSAATDTVTAKDRSGTLPPIMEFPTMKDIHEFMDGTKTYQPPAKKEETKK